MLSPSFGIILGGVDPPLGGDAVGPAGRILQAEGQDVVAQLGERGGGRRAGQPGPDDDDRELPLVGRIDELELEAVPVPLLLHRPAGDLGIEGFFAGLNHKQFSWSKRPACPLTV